LFDLFVFFFLISLVNRSFFLLVQFLVWWQFNYCIQ